MTSEREQESPVVGLEKPLDEPSSSPAAEADETQYPPLRDVLLVSVALYLAVFLVALVYLSSPLRLAIQFKLTSP